jgi:hypothetical protein
VAAGGEVVATAPGQATSVLAADPTLNMSPTDLAVLTALAELEPDLLADPAGETSSETAAAVEPVAATAGTPRPQPRPAGFVAAPAAASAAAAVVATPAVATAADMEVAEVVELSTGAEAEVAMTVTPVSTASAGLDIDPASVPVGSRLVQLGAFPTEAEAIAEWDRIGGAFAEYMEGKRRLIQQAETGGTSFYRLRAVGFADLSDARRFCAVLVAGNASCIPVVAR